MENNRGNQGSSKSGKPTITVTASIKFGYRGLEVELGTDEVRTPSDIILDFAYALNLLLAMDGIPASILSMFLTVASGKLKSLAKDVFLYGLDSDLSDLYAQASKKGTIERNYPREGTDKPNTD